MSGRQRSQPKALCYQNSGIGIATYHTKVLIAWRKYALTIYSSAVALGEEK